jgi:Flp pilus assembly protein TadG
LLLLLFGIIEFSLLLFNKQVITNASREGARAGIVAQDRSNYTTDINPKIREVVSIYAKDHLVTFGGDTLNADAAHIPITWEGTTFGKDLTVTVIYDYDFLVLPAIIVGLFNGGMGNTLKIQAQTVMKLE